MGVEAKDLQRYRGDIVGWVEENLVVRSPATGKLGYLRLEEHQSEWLREATRRGGGGHGRLLHKVCVASWP